MRRLLRWQNEPKCQEAEVRSQKVKGRRNRSYAQVLAMCKVPAARADTGAARLYPPALWRDVCRFLAGAVAVGAPSTVSARFKPPPVRAGAVPGAPFTAADRIAAQLCPPAVPSWQFFKNNIRLCLSLCLRHEINRLRAVVGTMI